MFAWNIVHTPLQLHPPEPENICSVLQTHF